MSRTVSPDRERLKALLAERRDAVTSEARSKIIPVRSDGSGVPLFFLLGGGANIHACRRLAELLAGHPVFGLQLEKITPDDGISSSIERLAALHREALEAFDYDGPYVLCGHSLSATVGLELGHQLLARGKYVPLVMLIDQPGPDVRLTARNWLYWQWAAISHLPWHQRAKYILNSIRYRLGASPLVPKRIQRYFHSHNTQETPTRANRVTAAEQRRRMNDATLAALANYAPKPFPNKMVLFRAKAGTPRLHSDPHGGWGRVAAGGIEVVDLAGHHMDLFQAPNLEQLSEAIDGFLNLVNSANQQEMVSEPIAHESGSDNP